MSTTRIETANARTGCAVVRLVAPEASRNEMKAEPISLGGRASQLATSATLDAALARRAGDGTARRALRCLVSDGRMLVPTPNQARPASESAPAGAPVTAAWPRWESMPRLLVVAEEGKAKRRSDQVSGRCRELAASVPAQSPTVEALTAQLVFSQMY